MRHGLGKRDDRSPTFRADDISGAQRGGDRDEGMGSRVKYLITGMLGSAYESHWQHSMGVLHSLRGRRIAALTELATEEMEVETLLAAAKAMTKEMRDLWNNITDEGHLQ